MKYSQRFFLISMLTAVVAMVLAYGWEMHWPGAIVAGGLGFFVWFGQYKQKWPWRIDLFLVGMVVLVIFGVLQGLRLYLLLPIILGTLAAWDLARFQQRIGDTHDSENTQKLEKRHLSLLALALGSGGILTGITLTAQLQISFSIALSLGVILIISFGLIYRTLSN